MSKLNDNKILLSLKIIVILALGLAAAPALAQRAYVSGYPDPVPVREERRVEMPAKPAISSVSPDEVKASSGANTITVTGSGFTPSSVVRINGTNRPTTFIGSTHLLAQANAYDFYRTDEGFYVTVWNTDQDYSNAVFVKVTGKAPAPANNNNVSQNQNYNAGNYPYNYGGSGYSNAPIDYYPGTLESADNDSSLASSVILGGNSFLPTGLVQWVFVAILIVGIIVLGRKVFGAREHYDNTPLKHA